MTIEMMKEYQNRIISASNGSLLVITYELLLNALSEGIEALENNDQDEFEAKMVTAHKLHRELSDNLDLSYEISKELLALYIYINKKMIEASICLTKEPLQQVYKVLEILLTAWKKAEKEQSTGKPLVENAQKVYAGLTYDRGQLNETIYSGIESRGFQA